MKRFTSAVLFLLSALAATVAGAGAQEFAPRTAAAAVALNVSAIHHGAKAPADEYFGRLKLSILGVRNTIADIDAREVSAEEIGRALCHKLALAEDALRDWQAKYPDDTWIPRLGYLMLADYEKIDTVIASEEFREAGVHTVDLASWLEATYPGSEFAPK